MKCQLCGLPIGNSSYSHSKNKEHLKKLKNKFLELKKENIYYKYNNTKNEKYESN